MILSFTIWMPIIFGLIVLFGCVDKSKNYAYAVSFFGALTNFLLTLTLIFKFDQKTSVMQFVEHYPWIQKYNISYFIGIDGLSIWFITLTTLFTLLIIISIKKTINKNVSQYYSLFLILSGLIIGAFSSLDGLLFYIFFEATLIPMYLIIGIWGGENRLYAALKFFLYTLLGSLLALLAILYLYISTDTFNILEWKKAKFNIQEQYYIFFAFFMAFAVKIPMFPFHTWLPAAHVEAPTEGSMILAAIMLKLGAYGFLRFLLPITPNASYQFSELLIILSLIGLIYISAVALIQKDIKKMIAYSSIAHMSIVTIGIFVFDVLGMEGAIIQMISHSFISCGMFFSIGLLYKRTHSRLIGDYGGLIDIMPIFSIFTIFFIIANCAMPITSGFVGEFLVILAAIKYNFLIGIITSTILVWTATYSLWMVKRVFFGNIKNENIRKIPDLNKQEFFLMSVLAIFVIAIGIYPKPLIDLIHPSVTALVEYISISKI